MVSGSASSGMINSVSNSNSINSTGASGQGNLLLHSAGSMAGIGDGLSVPVNSFNPQPLPTSNIPALGFFLPISVKEKIWQGCYVDFSLLYQENASTVAAMSDKSSDLEFKLVGDRMVLKQASKIRRKIDSLDKWQSAFHTFMSVFLMKHQHRWAELLKYAETIRTASFQFPGWGWKAYDEQFRLRQEANPSRSWGVVDPELWLTVAAAAVTHSSFATRAAQPQGPQGAKQGHCFAFNSFKGCHFKSCRFQHRCDKCLREGHGAHICRGNTQRFDNKNMSRQVAAGAKAVKDVKTPSMK